LLIANGGRPPFQSSSASPQQRNCSEFRGFITVPLAAIGIWWLVVKGSYKKVERAFC
jgi:hypothetical protein